MSFGRKSICRYSLQGCAVFFVFGHGGGLIDGSMKTYQTFWDGGGANGHWSFMVQTATARNKLLSDVQAYHWTYVPDIQVLDDLAAGALSKVLLAVFEGCNTSYWNPDWGSLPKGVVAKGAKCALGFTVTIATHQFNPDGSLKTAGAEEWADEFWKKPSGLRPT